MNQVLKNATIAELSNHYHGKVRDCYDLEGKFDGTRLIITTDRLSAFDKPITCIPEKGKVLTKTAEFWFRNTADICPNHLLAVPDPNVMLCRKLNMFPVEIVVRDYLAGTTDTSILQMYKRGERNLYGYTLPDGMRDNELLPYPMITPTTKSDTHDGPLTGRDVVGLGLMTYNQWNTVCRISLMLFQRGKEVVARNGLVLVDTKYEFGLDEENRITLADEIHTPDSSRYWFAEDLTEDRFNKGITPQSFDKDVVRHWIIGQCDPYNDPIPEVPNDVITKTTEAYIGVYKKITGMEYTPYLGKTPILQRIRDILLQEGYYGE